MATTIKFQTYPISEQIAGGKSLFSARVLTEGTVTYESFTQLLASETKTSAEQARYVLDVVGKQLLEAAKKGYKVTLPFFLIKPAIHGAFTSEDDSFDSARHELVVQVTTKDPLRNALTDVTPVNATASLTCSLVNIMDTDTAEENIFYVEDAVTVLGKNIAIDTNAEDEGLWLVNSAGEKVAQFTITSCDPQTINAVLSEAEQAKVSTGVYTLYIAARNGQRKTLRPATAKLANIQVNHD